MQWTYDKRTDTLVSGTQQNGCGVYKDEVNGKWYGNVVVADSMVVGVGGYTTSDEVQRETEAEYKRVCERLGVN